MFNQLLKKARKNKGLTQAEVAKKLYLSQAAYSKYETGASSPNPETLSRIAEVLEVSVSDLLGKRGGVARPGFVRVPVLGSVAAGIPIEAIEDVIDYEDLDADVFGGGEYFGLQVKGHSMEPKISDGDVVIVRRQEDVESGEIAVVLVNGDEATVKRIKKAPAGVTLIPSNPAYEPIFYTNDEIEALPVRVVGRVVELRAKL